MGRGGWGAGGGYLPFCASMNLMSGKGGCGICGWMSLSLISHTPSILYFPFAPPHTVIIISLSAHILLVKPISLSVSYCGFLGLCSGMGAKQLSAYVRLDGLAVSLVTLWRWSDWSHISWGNPRSVAAGSLPLPWNRSRWLLIIWDNIYRRPCTWAWKFLTGRMMCYYLERCELAQD